MKILTDEQMKMVFGGKCYSTLCNDCIHGCKFIAQKQLDQDKREMAYNVFEEIICPMCYRLNPQHADMDNGKGCHYCQEREKWEALDDDQQEYLRTLKKDKRGNGSE